MCIFNLEWNTLLITKQLSYSPISRQMLRVVFYKRPLLVMFISFDYLVLYIVQRLMEYESAF